MPEEHLVCRSAASAVSVGRGGALAAPGRLCWVRGCAGQQKASSRFHRPPGRRGLQEVPPRVLPSAGALCSLPSVSLMAMGPLGHEPSHVPQPTLRALGGTRAPPGTCP